jgi:hypothetical protein
VDPAPTKSSSLNSKTRLKSLLRVLQSVHPQHLGCNSFTRRVKPTSRIAEAPGATTLQTKSLEKEAPEHLNKQRQQSTCVIGRWDSPEFRHLEPTRCQLCCLHKAVRLPLPEKQAKAKARLKSYPRKQNRGFLRRRRQATLTLSLLPGSLPFICSSHATSPIPSFCHSAR